MSGAFPTFHVKEISQAGYSCRLLGSVSDTTARNERWIGERYSGYLMSEKVLTEGKWRQVGSDWEFTLEAPEHLYPFCVGSEYDILDCYWGDRAALVLDEQLSWTSHHWSLEDDHEHCDICWATIADGLDYLLSSSGHRICEHCHAKYVCSRSLAFIWDSDDE